MIEAFLDFLKILSFYAAFVVMFVLILLGVISLFDHK